MLEENDHTPFEKKLRITLIFKRQPPFLSTIIIWKLPKTLMRLRKGLAKEVVYQI